MLAAALATLAAAAVPATALAAPLPDDTAITIASYGGTTAWIDDDDGLAVRADGRTRRIDIDPVTELDLGPGPTGRTVAVYTRCRPSCDVYLLDLARRGAKELRLDVASRRGVSEHSPTIWRERIAFVRGSATYVAPVDNGRARRVDIGAPEDVELAPSGTLAYAGAFDRDDGTEATGVALVELEGRRRTAWVDQRTIGEGTAAGFGGLTAEANGLWYARRVDAGCSAGRQVVRRYDLRRRRAARAPAGQAPLAARLAQLTVPETPESGDCETR